MLSELLERLDISGNEQDESNRNHSDSNLTATAPLFGFLPRKVTGAQVRKALVC